MKTKTIPLFFLTLALGACLAPTEKRGTTQRNQSGTPASNLLTGGVNLSPTATATATSTVTATPTATAVPGGSGYESCNFNNAVVFNASSDIGPIRICRNMNDETRIRVKFDQIHSSEQVCFIPTYKDDSGKSTYLGPASCTYNEANQIKEILLYKTRPSFFITPTSYINFQTMPLRGVMVMMKERVPAFFNCMDAATIDVQYLCDLFMNGGEYLDIRLNQTSF